MRLARVLAAAALAACADLAPRGPAGEESRLVVVTDTMVTDTTMAAPVAVQPAAVPRSVPSTDPRIRRFVAEHDLAGRFHAREVLRMGRDGPVIFLAGYADGRPGLYTPARGLMYRGRIGWLTAKADASDLPRLARRRLYTISGGDAGLFAIPFARRAAQADADTWERMLAPRLIRTPGAPREFLAWMIENQPRLADSLLALPRVRGDADLLLRFRGQPANGEWRRALLGVLDGEPRTVAALSRPQVDRVLELLKVGEPHPVLVERLVDHPAVRRDPALLGRIARYLTSEYAKASARAAVLLALDPATPDSILAVVPWWETRPDLVRSPRIRRSPAVLAKLHQLDSGRFRGVRVAADSLLLANPRTDAALVRETAEWVASEARTCGVTDEALHRLALGALRHRAARADSGVAIALAYTERWPDIRAIAVQRLTGRPFVPRGRTAAQDERLRDNHLLVAHQVLVARMQGDAAVIASARAITRGRGDAEWGRILDGARTIDDLAPLLTRRGERENRLRRTSPFIPLLPADERAGLEYAMGCPPGGIG
jgi:hypothetical protein